MFAIAAFAVVGASSAQAYMFNTDLTLGSTGPDVVALQGVLTSGGYLTIPAGVAPGYFGALTQAAVAKWQAAVGIAPAAGYVGPITRAKLNGMSVPTTGTLPAGCTSTAGYSTVDGKKCDSGSSTLPAGCTSTVGYSSTTGAKCDSSTPGTTGPLTGGAGSVDSYTLISGLTNEKVGEDEEDVKVAGLEIEADDNSDLEFTAVRLVFNEGTAGSDFDNYATEVSIWFAGEEVARVDADEFNDDNDWTKTVSLESGAIVRAGDTEDLEVAISGISNLDSGDAQDTWTVDFTSVRFVDADGATISEDPATAARTFSFETFAAATNAELKLDEDDEDLNDPRVIDVHATDDTDGVELLSFTLEAEGDSDLVLNKFHASTTVTGASNVDDMINSITLWIDGEEIAAGTCIQDADCASVGSDEGWLFDDLDYTIDAGDEVTAVIKADFNSVADALDEGDTILVAIGENETDVASAFDVEDETGEELVDADITGSISGGAHAVYDTGFNATLVSVTATNDNASNDLAGANDTGTYIITFDVEAFGGNIFLDGDVTATSTPGTPIDGIAWATTTNSTGFATSTTQTTLESTSSDTDDVTTSGALAFQVEQDKTRRFFLTIKAKNGGADAGSETVGVRLTGLGWGTDGSDDTSNNTYTFDLGDYKTAVQVLRNI